MIKKLRKLSEYYGDRVAWKIGDLTAGEPYAPLEGVFSVRVDINADSHTFINYRGRGEIRYLDHSLAVMFWRWGIWVAARGPEVSE